MGLFSKFRENAVEPTEHEGDKDLNRKEDATATEVASPSNEKGLIKSMGEILQHSAHNMKEAVFGHMEDVTEDNIGSYPRALAMEEPFSQDDHVLTALIESDVRSSCSSGEQEVDTKKMTVQTVSEKIAQSAHTVKDAVLSHIGERACQSPRSVRRQAEIDINDESSGTDDQKKSIIQAIGEVMSQSAQTVKDVVVGNHNDVVESSSIDSSSIIPGEDLSNGVEGDNRKKTYMESVTEMLTNSVESVKETVLKHNAADHESMYDVRTAILKQETVVKDSKGKPHEGEEDEKVNNKGLMQSVKEAALEVKEAVQEVKEAMLSNDNLPNVPESITEEAGERPSMELVHTIVHD